VSQFSTYVITEPCVGVKDAAWGQVCPIDCIHTTPEEDQYYIDPSVCIACEQCALVCPVEAIFLDVEVPTRWRSYIEKNVDFYRRTKGELMPVLDSPHVVGAVGVSGGTTGQD
jgi:ferredoxin